MLTIKIAVGTNSFEFNGDVPWTEVRPLVDLWFKAIDGEPLTQAQIDQWTARVAAANDKLAQRVESGTPSS